MADLMGHYKQTWIIKYTQKEIVWTSTMNELDFVYIDDIYRSFRIIDLFKE